MTSQAVFVGFSCLALSGVGQASSPPEAEINNGVLKAQLYLPDAQKGFYRGTRFDWSGVIGSLEYQGHQYYGPWFTKYDPAVRDFVQACREAADTQKAGTSG